MKKCEEVFDSLEERTYNDPLFGAGLIVSYPLNRKVGLVLLKILGPRGKRRNIDSRPDS